MNLPAMRRVYVPPAVPCRWSPCRSSRSRVVAGVPSPATLCSGRRFGVVAILGEVPAFGFVLLHRVRGWVRVEKAPGRLRLVNRVEHEKHRALVVSVKLLRSRTGHHEATRILTVRLATVSMENQPAQRSRARTWHGRRRNSRTHRMMESSATTLLHEERKSRMLPLPASRQGAVPSVDLHSCTTHGVVVSSLHMQLYASVGDSASGSGRQESFSSAPLPKCLLRSLTPVTIVFIFGEKILLHKNPLYLEGHIIHLGFFACAIC